MTILHAPTLAAKVFAEMDKLTYVDAEPAQQDCECDFCGIAIAAGSPAAHWKPGQKFQDFDKLHGQNQVACVPCLSLFKSTAARTGPGTGYVTEDGFFPLRKDEERERLILEPPEKPFAAALVTAQVQHVWPFSQMVYDPNRLEIRMGVHNVVIDRPRVLEAFGLARTWEEDGSKRRYVFVPTARDLKEGAEARFTTTFARDEGNLAASVRAATNGLSLGGYWALSTLLRRARKPD